MPVHLRPRDRFRLANADRTNTWLDWCADPRNHEVLEAALAELAMNLQATQATDAAATFYKLDGARAYIHTLLNLAEQAKPPVVPVTQQLKAT